MGVACGVLSGCASDNELTGAAPTKVRSEWVTAATFAALDATGRFVLLEGNARYQSRAAADSFARAMARELRDGGGFSARQAELVQRAGAPIDFATLRRCGAATYMTVAWPDLPPRAPGYLRRAFGPRWNVPFCAAGDARARVLIDVPDGPRDFVIEGDTLVVSKSRTSGGGNNFIFVGVNATFPTGMALTAEDAVAVVFAATGTRIAGAPTPFSKMDDRLPVGFVLATCATWRVPLETPVRIRGEETQSERVVSELFVVRDNPCAGGTPTLYSPTPAQPPLRYFVFAGDTLSVDSALDSVAVPTNGLGRFEKVSVIR